MGSGRATALWSPKNDARSATLELANPHSKQTPRTRNDLKEHILNRFPENYTQQPEHLRSLKN
jgi:hypothetical protein